jgi:hypothetical protein
MFKKNRPAGAWRGFLLTSDFRIGRGRILGNPLRGKIRQKQLVMTPILEEGH